MGGEIMQKITFTNSAGQSVDLSHSNPYLLTAIDGTGAIDADVQMQKSPFQDGKSYVDSVLDHRDLSLEIAIIANESESIFDLRKTLTQVFNPKLDVGVLRYEYDGYIKEIEAVVDKAPVFPSGSSNRMEKFQTAIISLICPLPFWLDIATVSEPLIAWLGKLQYPLTFPTEFGAQGDSRVLSNGGDVSTPLLIEFRGPATNPVVTNKTTGEFIKVNRELTATNRLVIDTAFGKKRVEIVADDDTTTNVFNWIDLNSTFFQLVAGNNEIEYNADSGKDTAVVTISWRNRYVGI
jgi:phage-related protein